jgi:hypothetical protein
MDDVKDPGLCFGVARNPILSLRKVNEATEASEERAGLKGD